MLQIIRSSDQKALDRVLRAGMARLAEAEGRDEGRGAFRRASFTGLFVLLAASTMLFAAFTSAMVVRRGLSDDWVSMPKPPILLVNTAILLASSVALDLARRALRALPESPGRAGLLALADFLAQQTGTLVVQ